MVLFGAYNTAKRFFDDDRLTAHFPGPGSYASKSVVEGTPVPRYAGKLVEDGVVRPDGSAILFRERDCWVRGVEGPKVKIYRTEIGVCVNETYILVKCLLYRPLVGFEQTAAQHYSPMQTQTHVAKGGVVTYSTNNMLDAETSIKKASYTLFALNVTAVPLVGRPSLLFVL